MSVGWAESVGGACGMSSRRWIACLKLCQGVEDSGRDLGPGRLWEEEGDRRPRTALR